jgi:hypothetical protein
MALCVSNILPRLNGTLGTLKNFLKTFDIFEGRKPFRDEVSHSVISSPVTVLKCTVKKHFLKVEGMLECFTFSEKNI